MTDRHVVTLTPQESQIVYVALTCAVQAMIAGGTPDAQVTHLIAIRERFYVEDEA